MKTLADNSMGRRGAARRALRRTVVMAAAGALSAAMFAPGADARKISNPSPPDYYAEITGGYLQIVGSNGSPLGLSLDFDKLGYARPSLRGTVASDGTITFPKAQVIFAPLQVALGSDVVNLSLQPTTNWTGKIDPLSGRLDLDAPFRIQATGSAQGVALGGNCFLGSASNPLTLKVRTHLGTWPVADTVRSVSLANDGTTQGGTYSAEPYSDEPGFWPAGASLDALPPKARVAGSARAVDDNFGVPAASGCGPLNLADSQVNSQLGLPAPAGSSKAVIDVAFIPGGSRVGSNAYVNRGVAPKLVATGLSSSPWLGSEVPTLPTAVPVTLDAGSSYFAAGPNSGGKFQWDLGTGSFGAWTNTSVQTVTFDTPGIQTIRVIGRDADGDVSTTTRQINVVPSTDISLAASVTGGDLRGGSNGTYRYTVTNNSTERANTQAITFSAPLPAGTTFVSASGTGWSCGNASGTVTCTLPKDSLAAGDSSVITLVVAVSTTAGSPLASSGSVSQAGDPDNTNDTASLSTTVRKTDLSITNTRNGDFTANGVWGYGLAVKNVGDAATVGNTTVTTTLPEGMTYTAAGSGGSGWVCSAVPSTQDVSCVLAASIAAGADAPALTVRGRIANSVSGTISSSASVETQGDVDAFGGSNTDTEDADVAVVPDLAVTASHSGAFTVGAPGTYTLSVTNEAVLADGTTPWLDFSLPAGLKIVSNSGTGWDCSSAAGETRVLCQYATPLAAGESAQPVTLEVSVDHAAYPSTTLVASVRSDGDGYAPNNSSSDATAIKRINVNVSQTVAKSFSVGVEGVYRINATNIGDAATVGPITVRSELPTSVKLRGIPSGPGWDCSASSAQLVSCVRSASLAADTSAGLITARVDVLDKAGDDGQVENTVTIATERDDATVAGDAAVSGDNSSTITTKAVSVDLAVATSHSGDLRVGQPETVAVKVRNVGTFPTVKGASVTVTVDLPAGIAADIPNVWTDRSGWSCSAEGQTVTCHADAVDSDSSVLAVGATAAIEIPVTASDAAAESSTNTVTVSTEKDTSVEKSPNNRATDAFVVHRVDIALTASETIAPRADGIGEIQVGVQNVGTSATTGPISIHVPLAAGTTYRATGSSTNGYDCTDVGMEVLCQNTSSLAAGATAPELKIRTNVTTDAASSWTTHVSATTDLEPAERTDNNSADVAETLQRVDLKLVKSHAGHGIVAGKRGSYRLRVSNEGNVASSGPIRVTDTLPGVFTDVKAAGEGWNCSSSGQTIDCTSNQSLAAGAHSDVLVAVNVPTSASGTVESDPLASLSNDGDPYPSNNTSADPTLIVATQDLALSSKALGEFRVGQLTSIRYRVRNIGAETADGNPVARVFDNLPEGLVPVSYSSNDAWECDLAGGKVDCDLTQELEQGQASDLIVQVRTTGDAAAELGSVARVTAGSVTQDSNRSNDYAVGLYEIAGADLSVSANLQSGSAVETNRAAKFEVQVTNHGSIGTISDTVVTIPLTKGVTFNDTSVYGSGWDCRLVGDDVKCVRADSLDAGADAPLLKIQLTPSVENLPTLNVAFNVTTEGDEKTGDNSASVSSAITDLTPAPETAISDGPAAVTTSTSLRVVFKSSDSESTYECQLDGGSWSTCASPFTASGLEIGDHTFSVRATGSTGKVESNPPTLSWRIKKPTVTKPITANMTTGSITLPLSPDPLALPGGQLSIAGTVGDDGTWLVPSSGIILPAIVQDVDVSGIQARVKVIFAATGGAAGTITPGGGPANLAFKAQIKAEATLPGGDGVYGTGDDLPLLGPSSQCFLTPLDLNFQGSYDKDAGTLTLSQENIYLPKTSPGCGGLGATLDGALGLPLSTGVNMSINLAIQGGVTVGLIGKSVRADKLSVPVSCGVFAKACSGVIEVLGKVRSHGKLKTVVLSRQGYSVKRGGRAAVRVRFSRTVRRQIDRAGRRGMVVSVRVAAKGARKPVAVRSVRIHR